MSSPLLGRRDPQPVSRGWELAVALGGGALVLVTLAAVCGLGLAAAAWGGGWVWPEGLNDITAVLGSLVDGAPGRGLPPDELARVAAPTPTYATVAAAELFLVAAVFAGAVAARRRLGPGGRSGFATRAEATQALGARQLRSASAVIRPDLYGANAGRRQVCLSTDLPGWLSPPTDTTETQPASPRPSSVDGSPVPSSTRSSDGAPR